MGELTDLFDEAWKQRRPARDLSLSDAAACVSEVLRSIEPGLAKASATAVSAIRSSTSLLLQKIFVPEGPPPPSTMEKVKDPRKLLPQKGWQKVSAPLVASEDVRAAVQDSLELLESSPPPQPPGPRLSKPVLVVLQEMLKAEHLGSEAMALTASARVRHLLKGEGMKVVDYDAADARHLTDFFDVTADFDPADDPGLMVTPALVDAVTGEVVCRGQVGATESVPARGKEQ